jgi:hypothetical protein
MAKYDIFPSPSRIAIDGVRIVVVIQSDALDALATRLTVLQAELSFACQVPSRCRLQCMRCCRASERLSLNAEWLVQACQLR